MGNMKKDRFQNGKFTISVMNSGQDFLDMFLKDTKTGDHFSIIFDNDDIYRLKKCIAEYEKLNTIESM
jgi:type II secretory pathway component HofQ